MNGIQYDFTSLSLGSEMTKSKGVDEETEEIVCKACNKVWNAKSLLRHIGQSKGCKMKYGQEYDNMKAKARTKTKANYRKENPEKVKESKDKYKRNNLEKTQEEYNRYNR